MPVVTLLDMPDGTVRAEVVMHTTDPEATDRQRAIWAARWELSVQRDLRGTVGTVTVLRAIPGDRLFEVDLVALESNTNEDWD